MNIFDHLETGHRAQRVLIESILQAPRGAVAIPRLFDMLCDEIEAHNAAEEQTFHAALLKHSNGEELVRRSVDEHDEAADLITELSDLQVDSAAWRSGLAQLAECLNHHFAEEQSEALVVARQLIDDDLAVRLGDRFGRLKENWIEVFGRAPLSERRTQVVVACAGAAVARRAAGLLMRGRPGGWFGRWRRPARVARYRRFDGAYRSSGSLSPSKSGSRR